jgi:hypothetical protein
MQFPPQLLPTPVPTQASGHVVGLPQSPVVLLHVSTCVELVHCVVPGTHEPPQLLPTPVPTQAFGQVVGVPHCPFAPHVSTCVSLVH